MTPRWRLFPKYALLIIALVGGLLTASGATSIYFSWRETERNLIDLQAEKAQAAAARIEQYILDIEHQLGWTTLPALDEGSDPFEPRRTEYQKLFRLVPAITEVAWIDPNGREQVRISRVAVNVDGSNDDYSQAAKFKVAKGGTTYYGPVYFRKETEPYMTIARPAGLGGGVTAAEVNLKFVWEVVSRIRIGEKGLAWVVDDGGVLIAHPDISLVLRKTDLSSLPQVAALKQPGAVAKKTAQGTDGAPVLSANAAIPTLKWTVFVESPETEAFAPLYASILRAGLILGAGLLVSMVASFFVARALVRPLQALQEGAARVGAGELDRRIEVHTGDELEGLAEQFNRMSAQLRESYAGLERKVEQRTAELTESLKQQTATSEVLKLISRSTFDLDAVLKALLESAARLCNAEGGVLYRSDASGNYLPLVVYRLDADETTSERYRQYLHGHPIRVDDGSAAGRAVQLRKPVHIEDIKNDPEYRRFDLTDQVPFRNVLAVPLLRAGEPIGVIALSNTVGGSAFTASQIELVTTFADQAVIAIENVRLFNETQEALAHQTATADILRVISESPTDVQPAFDAIARRSVELCNALIGTVTQYDGKLIHVVAFHGATPDQMATINAAYPLPPGKGTVITRAVRDRAPALIPDVFEDADYASRAGAEQAGYRSLLGVPMLREGQVIGAIGVAREEVGPFPEKHVKLLKTFADQAVIAIENVRLFNETQEALERQTATAEILKVIASSPSDVQPVLEAIASSSNRLMDGLSAAVSLIVDGSLHLKAFTRISEESDEALKAAFPLQLDGDLAGARIRKGEEVQFTDTEVDWASRPHLLATARKRGFRSALWTPLMREGAATGMISVTRTQTGSFAPHHVELLRTFADQAVIAIENSRLFNETKEALERQTATAEVLRVISASVTETQPVFDVIAERAVRLTGATLGFVFRFDGELIHVASAHGVNAEGLEATRKAFPRRPGGDTAAARSVRDGVVVNIGDVETAAGYETLDIARFAGYRAVLAVPMLREREIVGAIVVTRAAVGEFEKREIDLLQTFASQAVIAIENVRLFNETKEALQQQTATAEVLKVISSSVSDAAPVFETILDSCQRLFASSEQGVLLEGEDGRLHLGAHHGRAQELLQKLFPVSRDVAGTSPGDARRMMHFKDVLNDADVPAGLRAIAERIGVGSYSQVIAPMMWEGESIGNLYVIRQPPVGFSDKEIGLLRTFADQAVIAIQNARLFNETREALEQQTATAEVLQVISSSVADTQPVFDKILDSCERLFAANGMGIYLIDDSGRLHMGGFRGQGPLTQAVQDNFPRPLEGTATALAVKERRVVHFADVLGGTGVPEPLRSIAAKVGNYSIAFAPMLWEGRGVGAIQVSRIPMSPFNAKELTLLKTFADQAVIAIQNARLFNEIQAKSRELELANKHKSEFLANMSHELRTPLNAIIGFSEVLSEKMFGEVNDKQLEYLLDIHTSGHHLLSLINDILDLSKIEAGRMELDLAATSLPMLLDNCTTLVRERASRNGLVLALEVEDGLGEWVADVRKLKQVVINLLSNAVKFTPAGGRVTLRARRLDHAVEIAVIDTGVGIAKDQQALVFEEFRQAGGDYLRKAEGTGLGLSLARRFVELHGGTMRVESEPGRGSTFSFVLPERVLEAAA